MTKKEKKEFLSMDMADRMIRVEQKVSAHFNKTVPYAQTEYYKCMNNDDKKQFDNFIKSRRLSKICMTLFIVLPIALLLVLNTSVTAGVIQEKLNITDFRPIEIAIWAFATIFTLLVLFNSLKEKSVDNRYYSHLDVLDNLSVGRNRFSHKKGF